MKQYSFMPMIRAGLKGACLVPAFLGFCCSSWLAGMLPVPETARRSLRIRCTSFFSRLALVLFGIRVKTRYLNRLKPCKTGRLIVANHVSYTDILLLAALAPCVFITSVELRNTPLLGMLARLGGSIFVERRRPAGLKREINEISEALRQGFSVVLFPEGTTSDGACVKPFKRSLFDAAVSIRAEVLPVCLRYRRIDEKSITGSNRNAVYYYDGVPFRRHFPAFLSLRSVEVEVTTLKSIKPAPDSSRKQLASAAHAAISAAYRA